MTLLKHTAVHPSAGSTSPLSGGDRITPPSPQFWALSQSRMDLQDPENAPNISIWGFLLASAQTQDFKKLSVYTERGTSSEELRFLYMNDFALSIWKQMGKAGKITGQLERPPQTAAFCFGAPFVDASS